MTMMKEKKKEEGRLGKGLFIFLSEIKNRQKRSIEKKRKNKNGAQTHFANALSKRMLRE